MAKLADDWPRRFGVGFEVAGLDATASDRGATLDGGDIDAVVNVGVLACASVVVVKANVRADVTSKSQEKSLPAVPTQRCGFTWTCPVDTPLPSPGVKRSQFA